jgi:hypothetical protein
MSARARQEADVTRTQMAVCCLAVGAAVIVFAALSFFVLLTQWNYSFEQTWWLGRGTVTAEWWVERRSDEMGPTAPLIGACILFLSIGLVWNLFRLRPVSRVLAAGATEGGATTDRRALARAFRGSQWLVRLGVLSLLAGVLSGAYGLWHASMVAMARNPTGLDGFESLGPLLTSLPAGVFLGFVGILSGGLLRLRLIRVASRGRGGARE